MLQECLGDTYSIKTLRHSLNEAARCDALQLSLPYAFLTLAKIPPNLTGTPKIGTPTETLH